MMIRKNNSGSVLVWGIVVSAVVVVLIGITLTISFSYYNRSVRNNYEKQAYFTARSVVETISSEIKGTTENGNAILDKLNNVGDIVDLDNISYSAQSENSGTTVASVTLIDTETIQITATTTVAEQTETVTATIAKGSSATTSLPIGEDFPGLEVPEDAVMVSLPHYINSGTETTDFYVNSAASVMFQSSSDFDGNIYTESLAILTISQGAKFSGNIYAQEYTTFTFTKLHNHFDGNIYVADGSVIFVNGLHYTITQSGGKVIATPVIGNSKINSDFLALLRIYTGTDSSDGWGDAVYE